MILDGLRHLRGGLLACLFSAVRDPTTKLADISHPAPPFE
jgi:hypothetical protein